MAGFDDIKEAALAYPPLTTVASDRSAMARAAVDLPRFPRAMHVDCGQNPDGEWHVTGMYEL